jgi:hypothetical protein
MKNAQLLTGRSQSGTYKLLNRLTAEKMLVKFFVSDFNKNIWGITAAGIAFSWNDGVPPVYRPHFEPRKIKPLMMNHHLGVQKARIIAKEAGFSNWVLESFLPHGLLKKPDATCISPDGRRISIEYERTIKVTKRYRVIISAYLQMIKAGFCDEIHYLCDTESFASSLSKVFSSINEVSVMGTTVRLNDRHISKFRFYTLDQWCKNSINQCGFVNESRVQ